MTETRTVVACLDCLTTWSPDGGTPACVDPDHTHQRFELHRHRTVVVLPDGTAVVAVSFDDDDPLRSGADPRLRALPGRAVAAAMARTTTSTGPSFGVPEDPTVLVAALRALLDRARDGEQVEAGCLGGHGRTGTASACLAVLAGEPAGGAVAWVRGTYCDQAVETPEQAAFVADLVI